MRETGTRYPVLSPAMNRRRGRSEHLGHGGCPPEPIDDFVGIGFHKPQYATVASLTQPLFSGTRNCGPAPFAVDGRMTRDEIREWADEARGRRKVLADALGITQDKVTKSITPNGQRSFSDREMAIVERVIGESTGRPYNGVSVVPLLGSVPAGNWREAIRDARGTISVPDPRVPPSAYALEPKGDSMDLVVMEGSRIVIDPQDTDLFPGRYYVVRNAEGETTFKQYKEGPPRLVPCSSNPEHRDIPMGEAFEVLGRVIGSYSRM